MKWLLSCICSILILSGCCGSEVVLRKLEVTTPLLLDTLQMKEIEADNFIGIKFKDGSKKDTAILAEFIPSSKKLIIKQYPKTDTVWLKDTIKLKPADIILRGNDSSERLIWIISFVLTSIIIIIYKR